MKLPRISGQELIRILKKNGFVAVRQRGDHVRIEKNLPDKTLKLTIPLHKELKSGTLLRIIKDAGLTHKEFEKIK